MVSDSVAVVNNDIRNNERLNGLLNCRVMNLQNFDGSVFKHLCSVTFLERFFCVSYHLRKLIPQLCQTRPVSFFEPPNFSLKAQYVAINSRVALSYFFCSERNKPLQTFLYFIKKQFPEFIYIHIRILA